MEYNLRTKVSQYFPNAGLMGDVGYKYNQLHLRVGGLQLQFDIVQRTLRLVDEDDGAGVIVDHLSCQLRPDRSGRPSDADPFVVELGKQFLFFKLDGLAAQQVFDVDVLQLLHGKLALHPLISRWHDPEFHLLLNADLRDLALALRRQVLDGDDDFGKIKFIDLLRHFHGIIDPDSVDDLPCLGDVIFKEGHHFVSAGGIRFQDVAGDEPEGGRTENRHAGFGVGRDFALVMLEDNLYQQPVIKQEEEGSEKGDEQDRKRNEVSPHIIIIDQVHQGAYGEAEQGGIHNAHAIVHSCITNNACIAFRNHDGQQTAASCQ